MFTRNVVTYFSLTLSWLKIKLNLNHKKGFKFKKIIVTDDMHTLKFN